MTPIADMVDQMFADGASLASILIAIRTAETVTLRERDASRFVTIPIRSKAAVRAARHREKVKQDKVNAEANDAARTDSHAPVSERDASRDGVTERCNLSSTSSLFPEVVIEKEVKKSKTGRSENTRARGTRMIEGAILADAQRADAIELGADPAAVDGMWAEFVDYWIGVPGYRGLKTDWAGTWRNRVRDVLLRGKQNGHRTGPVRKQSLSDMAFDLAEEARSAERARRPI